MNDWLIFFAVAGWFWCGWLAAGHECGKFVSYACCAPDEFEAETFVLIVVLGFLALTVVLLEGTYKYKRRYPWQSTRFKR